MTKAPPHTPVVFLDANVMLSASWSPTSIVADVLRVPGPMKFLTCTYALDEVRRNLQLKRPAALATLDELMARVVVVATILSDDAGVPLNEKDRPIYFSAKAARADILLTGDKGFQTLAATQGDMRIMTPREFLGWILAGRPPKA
jgi:predicted nucleic acid-binding protein